VRNLVSRRQGAAAIVLAATSIGTAHSFEFETGNPDLAIRWDNTFKYNYINRVERQSTTILANANLDDGDRNFNKGTVSNRIDILTDFDLVYRRTTGFRLSAAAWYDDAYRHLDNTSAATSNHLVNGAQAIGLSDATKRYLKGPSGELLDAFVFGRLDLGDVPVSVKLGRHTTFWGEALLSPIHSLSYGQAPLDLRKAASVPGVEAKELFMPRNALAAQAQLTPALSLAAQYFLDWKPFRIPEAGSYQGAADFMLEGGESLILGPGVLALRGADVTPKKTGDWGVSARWRPQALDGTLGFYYRKTADIAPQVHVNLSSFTYHMVYPGKIDILGVSLAKTVGSLSLGAEVSYRKNMPLATDGIAVFALPTSGETAGPRGNTVHGVVNLMGILPKTPVFDSANWIAEVQWNRLSKVTQGESMFTGRADYAGIDKATQDYFGLGIVFTPTWYQVFPGVDLLAPVSFSTGLSGSSAVGGGNKKAGNYSVGLGADAYQKYRFDLSYVDSFGPFRTDANGIITSNTGPSSLAKDRGFVSLTFKTTY